MDKKFDRLRRQQQRLWRKAAVSILSLHHNLAVIVAFLMIIILGTFWLLVDNKLDKHLSLNARTYGYGIARYSSPDLKELIKSNDQQAQQKYLQRITADPLIIEALLFDRLGAELAKSTTNNDKGNDVISTHETMSLLEDIIEDNQRVGILQVIIHQEALQAPVTKILNQMAIFIVVMMLLSTIIAWFITKILTKSLRKLLKFPIDTPEDDAMDRLDVSSELKLMLETSSFSSNSPAPVSQAEESGLHHLLAADSIAESAEVITLRLCLPDLSSWLKPDIGTPNVKLLRKLDRLLIMTIHSQQGHLLSFDGITAQACFGLDGHSSAAVYRAVSCSLLLKTLLEELSLKPKICLRREERLLIRHMKRTPVAIPIHSTEDDTELLYSDDKIWLLLQNKITDDQRLIEQMQLVDVANGWMTIKEINQTAQSMIERQLSWIRYLLIN